jgi:hypothetical protein
VSLSLSDAKVCHMRIIKSHIGYTICEVALWNRIPITKFVNPCLAACKNIETRGTQVQTVCFSICRRGLLLAKVHGQRQPEMLDCGFFLCSLIAQDCPRTNAKQFLRLTLKSKHYPKFTPLNFEVNYCVFKVIFCQPVFII